ncbi:TlpA family protein disulfide reductase [Marinimicrobium agarilyticum]|uniref:TlpA family protein disulfide reductase n=1 Tax=Marinimicrobium agarilyticum TaxID=306546 RepID=UPI00042A212B|nr:redoxin family protein [Marinimicrobium agarilyticum]
MLKQWCLAVVVLLGLSAQAQEPPLGDIELSEFKTGESVTLSELDRTQPTYIKLWATWCKPCMEQMPHFETLYQRFSDDVNIVAVNININENRENIQNVIERHKLTMPVWLDQEGKLAQALGLVGTPYSVLINADGNVVYTTHDSDDNLERFLQMLADGQTLESADTDALDETQRKALLEPWMEGEHLLFFTATWCDWYLKDSRPEMAQKCQRVQTELNALQKRLSEKNWQGVVNHLWTDEKALAEFIQLYELDMPFRVDTGGVLFSAFNVRTLPTLVSVKDGKVQARITDFSDEDAVVGRLSEQ